MVEAVKTKSSKEKEIKSYTNKREYSNSTYELRSLFKNECVIIPYTLYYPKIKEKLPPKLKKIIDDYKSLTYEINKYKRDTSKCYNKNLVSYLKKLYKYRNEPAKLEKELYNKDNGKLVPKPQFTNFINPTGKEISLYKKYMDKGWKNHPVYIGAAKYYNNLEKRVAIKAQYEALDAKILEKCKELWHKNYTRNHKHINPVARDRFWTLARGLVINTINQLYTIDIPENIPEIVDETLGRVYEGLMCFFDPNYKVDTFIYSITMSKISAYERARDKKEDAPELFHNVDEIEVLHDYYSFSNPKLPAIIESDRNIFIERHKSWVNVIKELLLQ